MKPFNWKKQPVRYVVSEDNTVMHILVENGISIKKRRKYRGLQKKNLVIIDGQSFVNDGIR
jgi:hypothetical protein